MDGGFIAEGPFGAQQPFRALVHLAPGGDGIARMQVEGDIQLRHQRPEGPVAWVVEIDAVLGIVDLGESVDEDAPEAEVLHATLQLLAGVVGILQRQRGETLEARGVLGDLARHQIIGAHGDVDGLGAVGNRLHRGGVEGQEHHLHAPGVHLGDALLLEVQQAGARLRPQMQGHEGAGIVQRALDGEMLFEPDLAFHRVCSRSSWRALKAL